ncbi:UNVERIFIED_CONTAM: hypothetical protein Slati_2604600 [Sesamum latifolium]|uniref:WW domain-containing protein n=1 Tax=Sesamum latifolium TaxID=2727402 RepID=A0AAW2VTU7_9LAMI
MMSLQTSEEILSDSKQLSKKRKWDDIPADGVSEKPEKIKSMKPISDYDSQNQTPFPLEWQQCLDIKSGKMFFYNTKTNKRASNDPKLSIHPYNPAPMSLDLELNPPCQSHQVVDSNRKHGFSTTSIYHPKDHVMISSTITTSPSWLTFEGDQQEMVTAVCKKCYMLVMMCKSTPACPNCKFMHSLDQEVEG